MKPYPEYVGDAPLEPPDDPRWCELHECKVPYPYCHTEERD